MCGWTTVFRGGWGGVVCMTALTILRKFRRSYCTRPLRLSQYYTSTRHEPGMEMQTRDKIFPRRRVSKNGWAGAKRLTSNRWHSTLHLRRRVHFYGCPTAAPKLNSPPEKRHSKSIRHCRRDTLGQTRDARNSKLNPFFGTRSPF